MNNNNKNKKQKQTHRYRKQTDSCQTGGFWEADEKDEMDQAKKKKTHRHRQQYGDYQREKGVGEGRKKG